MFHPRHCSALVRQIAGTEFLNPSALYCLSFHICFSELMATPWGLFWDETNCLWQSLGTETSFSVFAVYLTDVTSALEFCTVFMGVDTYFRSAVISISGVQLSAPLPLAVSMIVGVRVLPHQSTSLAS